MTSNKILAVAGLIALFYVGGGQADDGSTKVVGPEPDNYRTLDQKALKKITADMAAAAKNGIGMLPESAWIHEGSVVGAAKQPVAIPEASPAGHPGSEGVALVPPKWNSNAAASPATVTICPTGYSSDTTNVPSFVYFPVGHPGYPPPNSTNCVQVARNGYAKANVYTTLVVNNNGSSAVFAGYIGQPSLYGEILQFVKYDSGALNLYVNYFVATPADAAIFTSHISPPAQITYDGPAPNPADGIQLQILIPQNP